MPRLLSILSLTVFLAACKKDNSPTHTFQGNLPIVFTSSPATVNEGENILSSVRCELTSISGSVYFKGFDIKQISSHSYNISAKALYENWNTQLASPVMWTLDTTVFVKATTKGIYVLNFYNSNQLVKSDTVEAN